MKILIALLLSISVVNALPADSVYWIKFNNEQEEVIKQYLKENKPLSISKQKMVLSVRIISSGNPNAYELTIGATEREDLFIREKPTYFSEVENYPVAIYTGSSLNSILQIQYPTSYLDYFNKQILSRVDKKTPLKVIYTRRNSKGELLPIPSEIDERPLEKFQNWNVLFRKGAEPFVKRLL